MKLYVLLYPVPPTKNKNEKKNMTNLKTFLKGPDKIFEQKFTKILSNNIRVYLFANLINQQQHNFFFS